MSDVSDMSSGAKIPGLSKENECCWFFCLSDSVFACDARRLKTSCCTIVATMSCVTLEVLLTNSRTLRQKG